MTNTHRSPTGDPADMLGSLLVESQRLRVDVAEREQRQRRTTKLLAGGVAVALVMLMALIILLVQSRQRGNDTRALIRNNTSVSQQIADCTTVGGTCYEEGTRRSAALIEQLIAAQVAIENCAETTEGEAALRECVARELDTGGTGGAVPTPAPTKTP
jgi:hypothetical protein